MLKFFWAVTAHWSRRERCFLAHRSTRRPPTVRVRAFGSSAIRHESFGVETYSPYQDKDLTDACVLDTGDLELCFGSAEQALSDIEAHTHAILEAGKRPFLVGGEHLVTLGAFAQLPKNIQMCTSFILTPMQTCGTTIWAQSSPMLVSCTAAGSLSAIIEFSNSGFAPVTATSGNGAKRTFIPSVLIWKDSEKPLKRSRASPFILHSISTCSTRPYSPEPAHRSRAASALRHCASRQHSFAVSCIL